MRPIRCLLASARSGMPVAAVAGIALCALLALGHPAAALAEDYSVYGDTPNISATEAIVVDGDGTVLYSRNADTPMAMASITKVMTAVVALESGIPLDTTWTVTDSVTELDPASSVIGYQPGDQTTLNQLLHGLLVHSGNDAAVCIAELVAGSEESFVGLMNEKAAELGLANTHFANSHGLDADGHYSTAADLVALARRAMQLPLFASIVGAPSVDVEVSGVSTTFASTDILLTTYPGMRGIKTGYTANAGRAFLGLATRGDETVYVVVLGTNSEEQRWADTTALLDWAFAHCEEVELVSSSAAPLGYVANADRFGWSSATEGGGDAVALTDLADGSEPSLSATVSGQDGSLHPSGEQIAQITWTDEGGSTVSSRSVRTSDAIVPTQTFGPFVSDDFYGLDRF